MTPNAWTGFAITSIVICLILVLILYLNSDSTLPNAITKGFGTVFRHLLQRGNYEEEYSGQNCLSFNVVMLVLNMFSILMFVVYAALLVSFMASPTAPPTIRSFEDIYDQNLPLYTIKGSSNEMLLAQAPKGSAKYKIYHEHIMQHKERLISYTKTNFESIFENDPNALFFDITNTRYNADSPNQYESLENSFDETTYDHLAPAVQKDSEYQDIFNYHLGQMHESGIMHRLEVKWFHDINSNGNTASENNKVFPVGFREIFVLILSMLGGTLFSLIVLIIEAVIAHGTNTHK